MKWLPFTPGQTQQIALTAASQPLTVNPDAAVLRVLLEGGTAGAVAFVRFGTGTQTAALTDFPIVPNVETFITKGVGANGFAAIGNTAGVGAILFVTTGE